MGKLRPCPFCGGKAEMLILPDKKAHWAVKCTKGCVFTCQHISEDEAEYAWNYRSEPDKDDKRMIMGQVDTISELVETEVFGVVSSDKWYVYANLHDEIDMLKIIIEQKFKRYEKPSE